MSTVTREELLELIRRKDEALENRIKFCEWREEHPACRSLGCRQASEALALTPEAIRGEGSKAILNLKFKLSEAISLAQTCDGAKDTSWLNRIHSLQYYADSTTPQPPRCGLCVPGKPCNSAGCLDDLEEQHQEKEKDHRV